MGERLGVIWVRDCGMKEADKGGLNVGELMQSLKEKSQIGGRAGHAQREERRWASVETGERIELMTMSSCVQRAENERRNVAG